MPNSPTHDKITIACAVSAAIIALYATDWRTALIWGASTAASGLMLSPDLDLNSTPSNRFGPLEFIWWPYRKMVSHRSSFSHGYIIGVPTRMLNLYAAFVLLSATYTWFFRVVWPERIRQGIGGEVVLAGTEWGMEIFTTLIWSWGLLSSETHSHPQWAWAIVGGAFLGAWSHIAADQVWSMWKKGKPKRKKALNPKARFASK